VAVESDQHVADAIVEARRAGRTMDAGSIPIDDDCAYAVQELVTSARMGPGERIVGWKLGYTSAVMRAALGIDSPNAGPLTDAMVHDSPARIGAGLLQPRVEPEIAVVLDADGRIAQARPALEVVDSVWSGYRFDWAHNTADGSSAAAAVVGPGAVGTDWLASATVTLTSSSGHRSSGSVAAQLPDLEATVAWLQGLLRERGRPLPAGAIVLTGGLLAPVELPVGGWVRARFASSVVGPASAELEVARG
jgi:2-keto-4-pentenoate hydratase